MRVAQNKPPSSNNAEPKPAAVPAAEGEEEETEESTELKSKDPQLLISGAVAKGHGDFPTQAVKSFHEKPHTPNEVASRPHDILILIVRLTTLLPQAYAIRDHSRIPNMVHQPRRQN